jgi:hypothetical protein
MKAKKPSKPFLPWELIDEILLHVGDCELALQLNRFTIILQEADFNWAIESKHVEYLKYLNKQSLCDGHYEYLGLEKLA